MCDVGGGFVELDILTCKKVNSLPVKSVGVCVLTHNKKSLITAENGGNCNLIKWSTRSNKQLYTWKSGLNRHVYT